MTLASTTQVLIGSDQHPVYLRTGEAAKYLNLGKSTLDRYRVSGKGPSYRVLGEKIVVYTIADLDAFARQQVRSSTTKRAA